MFLFQHAYYQRCGTHYFCTVYHYRAGFNGGKAEKTTAKKETKKAEKTEAVDYSKMTVAELKEVAASKNIEVAGMKKAEIIEALTK